MFGFILPNIESLEDEEKKRYRAAYCGVCCSLKQRYGQLPRVTVSFDMTFLALVLGSLYEPQETKGAARCPLHPAKPQAFAQSEYSNYAADLSVAFAYHKLLDDWHDDHTIKSRAAAFALAGAYRKAKKRIPQECRAIEEALAEIQVMEKQIAEQEECDHQIEPSERYESNHQGRPSEPGDQPEQVGRIEQDKHPEPLPFDAPANRFGLLLGDIFAHKNDFWVTDLRRFGARLGKFVYVMDAAMDLEEDLRTGSYNPFKYMDHDPQALRDNLEYLAASMTEVFERLPLERDLHLLRSVLYAGVWQRFEAKENKSHDG